MGVIKIAILLLLLRVEPVNIIEIRNLFELASTDKKANSKLTGLLTTIKHNDALLIGYKGAAIMMEANYVFNPLSKLSKFKTGKKLVENAIKIDQTNVELRYIRLTIQTNVPSFLGYSNAIAQDKNHIINELDKLKDKDLRSRMVAYLLQANICTQDELRKVNLWKNK